MAGPRRGRQPARCGEADRGGQDQAERRPGDPPGHLRERRRHRPGRWQGGGQPGPRQIVALPQARGPGDHPQGPGGPPHRVRAAARAPAPRGQRGPTGPQQRGPVAADQRWRPGAATGATLQWLDPPVSRPRARRGAGARTGGAGGRRGGGRRQIRSDRGWGRFACDQQHLVERRPARGSQPRGAQGDGPLEPAGDPAHPRRLRAVPAGQPRARRCGRDQRQGTARPATRHTQRWACGPAQRRDGGPA